MARYRQVRYLFHLVISVVDPSCEPKDRLFAKTSSYRDENLERTGAGRGRRRLLETINDLLTASVKVCSDDELQAFDGSVGLDATPVPLFSRGPSVRGGTSASDPDGGWYVREGDHRELEGPKGKKFRKLYWALEATIVTMGRGATKRACAPEPCDRSLPRPPGGGPAGTGRSFGSGPGAGLAGPIPGCGPGLHPRPPRAVPPAGTLLGYSLVMDYKAQDLGRQANSQGAVLVDGAFYCPAMPEVLVTASADGRAGAIDEATYEARIAARANWRLCESPARTKTAMSASPARRSGTTHVFAAVRPGRRLSASCPCSLHRRCFERSAPRRPSRSPRYRGAMAPGPRFWIRAMGEHLCELPQHDRGAERLYERPGP